MAIDYKSKRLHTFQEILEDELRNRLFGGKPCLVDDKLQSLVEKINKLSYSCNMELRQDVTVEVDEDLRNKWIAQNPFCVSRETWEKFSYVVCDAINVEIKLTEDTADCDLNLTVIKTEDLCDLSFQIVRNMIPCDIIVALQVRQQACDLNLGITRTEEENLIDCELLNNQEVLLLNDEYNELIANGFSYDIIKTIYDNNASLEITDNGVNLITTMGTYPIKDMNFKGLPNLDKLNKIGVGTANSKYVANPRKFLHTLKQDYSG